MHHHYAKPPEYREPMHWSEKLILIVFIAVLIWFGLCVAGAHSSTGKPMDAVVHQPHPATKQAAIPSTGNE